MASTQSDIAGGVVIDGIHAGAFAEPGSAAEIAAVLADHAAAGKSVAPIGGGSKLALGNVPATIDTALSTAALNRVLHYEPTDMTLSVEAGIRFADLQAVLAERGQTLPIDVPDAGQATIGGLIATAMAGPRRLGSGTLRDLLIGISCAYPSGIVAKAGGLVVKNVTGFDLMRLHLGALGTLGVVVSANFKVLPLARSEATLLSEAVSLETALERAHVARAGRTRPIAVEVFNEGPEWRAAARIEGRSETVRRGLESLRDAAGWSEVHCDSESRVWWRAYVDSQSIAAEGNEIVVRCGVEPKRSGVLVTSVMSLLASRDIFPKVTVSPGLGTVRAKFAAAGSTPESMLELQSALLGVADNVTVLKAPALLKQLIDVWGNVPETISLMRALKAEFDPANVLNPGRFVDRI